MAATDSESSGVANSSDSSSSPSRSTDSDYDVFRDALQHFAAEQSQLTAALQHSQHSLDLHFATFDSQLKRCTQQWAEYTRLQAMQHDLYAGMSKDDRRRVKAQMVDDDIVMELAKQQLDQWRQCKPNNQSRSQHRQRQRLLRFAVNTAIVDLTQCMWRVHLLQLVPAACARQGELPAVEEDGQGQHISTTTADNHSTSTATVKQVG